MSGPFVGQRVFLMHLLVEGKFPGTITGIDLGGLCTVQLDIQENPVQGVLYHEGPPEVVVSNLWQVCYPSEEEI